ncbi:ATP-binding protein [Zhouia sp. PK063]|uniref:tetratricopeptide repeat-containing hybrid sensor histidine kinase/response regulator n=1 Tax=Zhouia sp. PK063 TaxID=3373602 RepID=UPI0037B1715F
MRTPLLILIAIIALPYFANAQEKSFLDSINRILTKAEDYNYNYDIKSSLEEASKAIKMADSVGSDYYLAWAYNTVGLNYEVVMDWTNARKNYQKALQYALLAKNDTLTGWAYNNLGNVYSDGDKNVDQAIFHYNKSIEYAKKIKDSFELVAPTLNIGWTYIDMKQQDKAYPFLMEALKINSIKKYHDRESESQIHYLLGDYYNSKKQYTIAIKEVDKAIGIADSLSMFLDLSDMYKLRSNIYKSQDSLEQAFTALTQSVSYKDKVFDKQKMQQLEVAKAQFALSEYQRDLITAEKDKQVQKAVAEKSQVITYSTIVIAVVFLFILIIVYSNYKSKSRLNDTLKTRNESLAKAKKEAERLASIKTQFISTVSHELRTPLYGVIGLTSLLMESKNFNEEEHQYLKSLKFSGDYLLNLINDVLQLSKIEANKIVLDHNLFNLDTLVKDILFSFEKQAESKGNIIKYSFDEKLYCMVEGDRVRLSQILINLIGNAVKFNTKSTVEVHLNAKKIVNDIATIRFVVKDNGIGIPQEMQERIFEDFSQINNDKDDLTGTGLGLSIVKKLTNIFGSSIQLKSEEGKGSVFTFDIDFKQRRDVACTDKEAKIGTVDGTDITILVVEDNKVNQIVTKNILIKSGFKCKVVANGEEAISAVQRNDFNLVLMDLNMPGMNGFEATKKIREFDKEIPIIALTALEIEQIRLKLDESGINDIINKPYDKEEFYQTILRNLGSLQS